MARTFAGHFYQFALSTTINTPLALWSRCFLCSPPVCPPRLSVLWCSPWPILAPIFLSIPLVLFVHSSYLLQRSYSAGDHDGRRGVGRSRQDPTACSHYVICSHSADTIYRTLGSGPHSMSFRSERSQACVKILHYCYRQLPRDRTMTSWHSGRDVANSISSVGYFKMVS